MSGELGVIGHVRGAHQGTVARERKLLIHEQHQDCGGGQKNEMLRPPGKGGQLTAAGAADQIGHHSRPAASRKI